MTTIAVIGAGHIGHNFSLAAIAKGYQIVIANNSGPETIADLVEELGPRASAAVAALAFGPSSATSSPSVSGPRLLAITIS